MNEHNKLSQRLMSNVDRIKLSIMTTRSNAIQTPIVPHTILQNIIEDRSRRSGFSTSKNAYVKHQLLRTQRNNNASGPANFPSMTLDRTNGNSSELNQSIASKPEALKGGRVPQLLLT